MKRILCLLIAVLMLMSVGVMSVGAEDLRDEVEAEFSEYCVSFSDYFAEVCISNRIVQTDEAVYFIGYPADCAFHNWTLYVYVGDWVIIGTDYEPSFCSGVYALIDGEVYPVEDAYEQGLITNPDVLKSFYGYYSDGGLEDGGPVIYRIGDADLDREITVKDATAIQKHLAELQIIGGDYSYVFCDMDDDYTLTIRDATAIQKKLAGIAE